MKFNEKLLKLRIDKNLSQEQLAEQLDVSRQAVSKWESGQTYPEMDKLIMMCRLFKCSLDDLTNDEINVTDILSKKKGNNINNYVDELLDLIKRTTMMFKIMTVKEIAKCIIMMAFIFVVLLICYIPFDYLDTLGREIFINMGGAYNILSSIWQFLLNVVYLILFIIIYVYIYKTIYLDKYENIQIIEDNFDETNKREDSIINKKQEKVIVKVKKESSYKFLKVLSHIVSCFIKFFIFCCGLPFVFCLIALFATLVISIFLMFKGVFYVGILLGIIFSILFTFLIVNLIFYFLFNKKIEIKRMFILFVISIAGIGASIGICALEFAETDFVNEVPKSAELTTLKKEYDYNEKLYITPLYAFRDVEYIADDDLKTKVVIEIKYYKDYVIPMFGDSGASSPEGMSVFFERNYDNFIPKNLINLVLDDLSNKQLHNYEKLYEPKITIYSSSKNLQSMEDNMQEYLKNEARYDEQFNYYNGLIEEYQQQILDFYDILNEKDNQIYDLESEIEELNNKIQEYKNRIKELLE